jgi:hypothetical protein
MIKDYFVKQFTILSRTTGPTWGTETAWSTGTSKAKVGWLNPVAAGEHIVGEKKTVLFDYKLFCSSTVDLDERKRIKSTDSHYYDVVFVKDTLGKGHHLLAYLKRYA